MDLVRRALILVAGAFLFVALDTWLDPGPWVNFAIVAVIGFCVGVLVIPDAGGLLDPDREHKSRWLA